jgi:hypothetical protein
MIRIRLGIKFRNSEVIKLEKAVTAKTETPITMAGCNLTVMAKDEQIPKT